MVRRSLNRLIDNEVDVSSTLKISLSIMITLVLLLICTCTYLRSILPQLLDQNRVGWKGTFWKLARIGERLSPCVASACLAHAFILLCGY